MTGPCHLASALLVALALLLGSVVPVDTLSTASGASTNPARSDTTGVPEVAHPASGPSWSTSDVCGATTKAGRVQPGPTCSPNPPDVIPTVVTEGAVFGASPQTGQVVFWDSGWENHGLQMTWEFDNSTGTWINDTSTTGATHPDPAASAEVGCMTWDPVGSYFLAVAGSSTPAGTGAETWTFSNHRWTNASIDLADFGGTCTLVWDYADREAVLYYPDYYFDAAYTFVWTGTAWSNVTISSGTGALGCVYGNAAAWDAHDGEVVSFGGAECGPSTVENWTWAFSEGTWTNLTETLGPVPPAGRYDGVAGVSGGVLLFTEGSSVNTAPEHWFFGARNWTQETVAPDPVYGSACQRSSPIMGAVGTTTAFLFGGDPIATSGSSPCYWSGGGYFNDSWEFTGTPALSSPGSGGSFPPPGNGSGVPSRDGISCGSEVIAWTNGPAPAGTSLVNVTVFLYRGTSNGSAPVQVVSANGPATSLQVNGLECGADYVFQVLDWYSGGLTGPLSGEFGFITAAAIPPSPPTCLSCGSPSSVWPWAVLALVILVAVVTVLLLVSGSRRGDRARRIG